MSIKVSGGSAVMVILSCMHLCMHAQYTEVNLLMFVILNYGVLLTCSPLVLWHEIPTV